MKKVTIGYIFNENIPKREDKLFKELAKEKNIDLIMINTNKILTEKDIEYDVDKCDLFFNNSTEDISMEVVKTIEELGDRVIEPSNKFYYFEDKWLFFMKCIKHKIPTVETILLSENIPVAKRELIELNNWPVVLKRVQGNNGEYVERADNSAQAEKIMKKFWKKGSERLSIIAQEYIDSLSYRVTVVGGKIVQTAIRPGRGWKKTGNYSHHIGRFNVDNQLKKLIDKIIGVFGLKICGIDLLKKDGKWLVLEINAQPGLDFFNGERKKLVGEILDYMKKQAK